MMNGRISRRLTDVCFEIEASWTMTKHMSSDERSKQILSAAKACFLAKGYFATRMDEIAKAAGLSKGGVYFHFDSKRDIFRALVQEEYDAAVSFIDSVVVGEGHMATKLLTLGEHFTALFSTSADNPRFMAIIGEMALRDKEIEALLREIQENHVNKMTELIDWGIGQGQLRDVDAGSVAYLLKSLIDGIQASYAIGYEVDLERVLAAGLDLVMRGITRDSAEE